MDLRSVLNTSDNGERPPAKAPPTPQQQQQHQQHQQHQPQQPQPARPSPGASSYGYREYPHHPPPHASPAKPGAPEYGPQGGQYPQGAYPPPSPYQTPGPYPPRGGPPNTYQDPRSPGGAAPIPSPYRHPSAGPGGQGYPFPPGQVPLEISSPSQRHQYPSGPYQHQRQDSLPPGSAGAHPTTPYIQHHQVPQTPPVAHPGGHAQQQQQQQQQQAHQRSQSAQSTPTPTSAHSQHPFGPPFAQGSPAPQHRQPPAEYSRHPSHVTQPSQPPTPQAQAPPTSKHPSASFSQPPSPYQNKMSVGAVTGPSLHSSPSVAQPPQHGHRSSLSHSARDSPSRESQKARSASEREHSLSVSPKTRVGSLPSNAGNADHRPTTAESEAKPQAPNPALTVDTSNSRLERTTTPAKRKLEQSSISPGEMENKDVRPPPGEVNGRPVDTVRQSPSPAAPRKGRVPRSEPPIWAQSIRTLGKEMPKHANFVLHKKPEPQVNGKQESPSQARRPSRAESPEETKSQLRSNSVAQAQPEPGPQDILGPWEASITGVKPYEEMSKAVADFLFIHVINAHDAQEIASRGIEFEVEAKLGTLIDKDTNHRVDKMLDSECVLHDTGRVAFKSSMTEAHHKAFNEFLNHVVIQTDPRAPHGGNRVQVHYKHRREIDKYFELPPDMQGRIPGCVRARMGGRKSVRARVTYDQKTGEVLAKIVKARVADIDLHMPMCPMDCRISINLEMNWDGPAEELEQLGTTPTQSVSDRRKDRLSYKQGHYQVDLTQVTMPNGQGPQRTDKEHELEIEVSAAAIIEHGRRAMSGEPHRYQELVEGFVDNVRVLSRKARDFS